MVVFFIILQNDEMCKGVSVSGVDFEYKKSNKHVLDCDDILINRGFGRSG